MTSLVIAVLACAAWGYLLLLHGGFWRANQRDDDPVDPANPTEPAPSPSLAQAWPRVVAIVPARNEAEVIATSAGSLLAQDYRGDFTIIVVDDHSTDGTATIARSVAVAAAGAVGGAQRLAVVAAQSLPEGWTGKLWAINCGVTHVDVSGEPPDYLWLTDADIAYSPETLTTLVRRAQRHGLVLASLMAKLRCESGSERAAIPAFILFFQMLYPFAWVNRPETTTAAAAGGCMLVQRKALQDVGGIAAVRGELIDDCALARRLKRQGPIWLGLTQRAHSLRAYGSLSDIRQMVSRCAYAQLRYSPWLLAGTVLGLTVIFLAPPILTIGANGLPQLLGAAAWVQMALAMQPTLRFYGVSRWWGLALPVIAGGYLVFTLDSAWAHWCGRGGMWKGRAHSPVPEKR